jgi:hypothetical protein
MMPEHAPAVMFPRKYQANRLLVSSRLYQRVMVNNPAGMKPDSQNLDTNITISNGPQIAVVSRNFTHPSSSLVSKNGASPFWKA